MNITNKITKKAFEKTFRLLIWKRPLAKVTVRDITKHSGLSRNSFYYHFNDKYELMNWIFYSNMMEKVDSFQEPCRVIESFVNTCKCLYNEREFYIACFQYTGQNSLFESFYNIFYELWKVNLDRHYKELKIKCTKEELNLRAQLNTYAMTGILYKWVKEGMNGNYIRSIEKVQDILNVDYFPIPREDEDNNME